MKHLERAQTQVQIVDEEISIIDSFPMMLTLTLFFVVTFFVFFMYPMAEAFAALFI